MYTSNNYYVNLSLTVVCFFVLLLSAYFLHELPFFATTWIVKPIIVSISVFLMFFLSFLFGLMFKQQILRNEKEITNKLELVLSYAKLSIVLALLQIILLSSVIAIIAFLGTIFLIVSGHNGSSVQSSVTPYYVVDIIVALGHLFWAGLVLIVINNTDSHFMIKKIFINTAEMFFANKILSLFFLCSLLFVKVLPLESYSRALEVGILNALVMTQIGIWLSTYKLGHEQERPRPNLLEES